MLLVISPRSSVVCTCGCFMHCQALPVHVVQCWAVIWGTLYRDKELCFMMILDALDVNRFDYIVLLGYWIRHYPPHSNWPGDWMLSVWMDWISGSLHIGQRCRRCHHRSQSTLHTQWIRCYHHSLQFIYKFGRGEQTAVSPSPSNQVYG